MATYELHLTLCTRAELWRVRATGARTDGGIEACRHHRAVASFHRAIARRELGRLLP